MTRLLPSSLKFTVLLVLLGFAAALSALNLVYQIPRAQRAVEEEHRERLLQELSRLQSTLEYLLLKGDLDGARREVAILASNRNYTLVTLTDDADTVIASTRRMWLGRRGPDVLPQFTPGAGAPVLEGRDVQVVHNANENLLLGYAGIPMGGGSSELRSSRMGRLFFEYDLTRANAAVRAEITAQSLYWTGWVIAMAAALWVIFHFLLTRRTEQLVRTAEQLAAGNLSARSALSGKDELGQLGRAFDAMASKIEYSVKEKRRAAEELARQREMLHQREKLAALGSLLAGVAHELNNPLSVVVARAAMLEEHDDSSARTAASKIRAAAERCARIVRTFLAMARKQQPERVPVALHEVISAALDLTGYALKTSGVEVRLDMDPRMPAVLADPDQLHQVFMNLFINAQQALQDVQGPRELRLASRWDDSAGVVWIDVADNGPGIPADLLGRIFEPYFTTKPSGSGTGVGLAVCLGIIEAHGGSLSVESDAGSGTVFTVQLPVADGQAVNAGPGDPEESSAGRHAVLVVDDETEVREMVAEVLRTAGHRVAAAASGDEALDRLGRERFDVIMTDIRMPGLDGIGLYAEIARRWPDQVGRIVFMSGDTLTANLREFAARNGRPVIEKPFLPGDVRRVVAEVVGA